MLKKWRVLNQVERFSCKWFSIYQEKCQLPDGTLVDDYFVTQSNDIATIIAFTKNKDLILLKEYKHGIQDIIWTFPSGIIEKNEDPYIGAKRELSEETGYTGNFKLISKSHPNPTSGKFIKYTYLALNCIKTSNQNLDITEFLEVHIKSIEEVVELIRTNKLNTDLNIASFYKAIENLGLIQIKKYE